MNGAAAPAPCPFCQQQHPEEVFVCPTAGKVLPLEGRLLDGKFQFKKLLGAGGMGAVWRAQNIRVRKAVAIKLMHAEFAGNPGILERFRNEATAAGQIGNGHICDIYDFGSSVLGPYIVLEMLNGRSLGELVQQSGQVDPGLVVLIIRQALVGLEAAHAVGIIHRDLKPENIFLHEPSPGHLLVKLMDFGISKFSQGGTEGGGQTSAGVLMGTPEYMSPEQTEGAAGVDQRTDIWAMGAILYKALTGADAFLGPSMAATLVAVSTKQHPPVAQLAPHVPPGLIAVVDRCLAKDPAARYASCAELSFALAPFEQLGAPMPAMASHTHAPPMTAPPQQAPSSPGATVITGGGPPAPVAPAATLITGGPPQPAAPPPATPTWSNEIAQPSAEDCWSIGGNRAGAGATQVPQPTSGGGGKAVFLAVVVLLLGGAIAGAVFFMGPDPKGVDDVAVAPDAVTAAPEVAGNATAPATTAAPVADPTADPTAGTPPPETPPDDTKAVTPPPDTKTEAPEPKPEVKKPDDDKKPAPKAKELVIPDSRLPGKMLWDKAKDHCAGLSSDGIKSWRLPKASELLKFKRDTKLTGRKYWTSETSGGDVKVVALPSGKTETVPPSTLQIDVACVALK